MRHTTVGLALLLALSGGCTFLNAPSDLKHDAGVDASQPDAGMDAGDAGPTDAAMEAAMEAGEGGMDAGDGGSCVAMPREVHETSCNDHMDNDCDGLTDCHDPDCASAPNCCDMGSTAVPTGQLTQPSEWATMPSGASFPGTSGPSGLQDFGTAYPKAIRWNTTHGTAGETVGPCEPLALGADITVDLTPHPEAGSCAVANCFAGLVLSGAQDMRMGQTLLDDLAVLMDPTGTLTVQRAGRTLASASVGTGQTSVQIGLGPGVDDRGHAVIEVSVTHAGTTLLDTSFPQSDLVNDLPGCQRTPGLNVAIEGWGNLVSVDNVVMTTRACVNPSQFTGPGATLGHASLVQDASMTPACWAQAGVGSPGLAASFLDASGSTERWDVVVEGTNDDPSLDLIAHVGRALAHADATNWGDIGTAPTWQSTGQPMVGDSPPSCLSNTCGATSPCSDNRSYRDPFLYAKPMTSGGPLGQLIVAYARESDAAVDAGTRDVYDLYAQDLVCNDPTMTRCGPVAPDSPTLTAGASLVGSCDSLRDPALLPIDASGDSFWLLFTCKKSGHADSIHAVQLQQAGTVYNLAPSATDVVVLDSASLGSYAAAGVRDPEPVATFDSSGHAIIRLWFVGLAVGGRATIGLAEAETTATDLGTTLPTFVPYGANPVLTPESTVIGGCGTPECCASADCPTIQSLAVARSVNTTSQLRFLVARRVNTSGGGQTYDLVPLTQFWRTD